MLLILLMFPLVTMGLLLWLTVPRGEGGTGLSKTLAAVCGIAYSFDIVTEVIRSDSSTAAVGIVFLPFAVAAAAAVAFLVGKASETVLSHMDRTIVVGPKIFFPLLGTAAMFGVGLGW